MKLEFTAFTPMKTRFEKTRTHADEFSVDGFSRFHRLHTESTTILLISNDRGLHENVRSLANKAGLKVVKVDRAGSAVGALQTVRPSSLLLDLDLPNEAAWETADILLNEPDGPVVILITGRTGRLDMQSAMRAGLLLSKGDSSDRLLKIIEEAMEMPRSALAQQNALRREFIRWLRPPAWLADSTSAYRFWGINE